MTPLFARCYEFLDARLRLTQPTRTVAQKLFPSHWSFLLGEVALASLAILVLTGIFLTMFYRPTLEPVLYAGSNPLFMGRQLPAAYESIIRLSSDVPGGLLIRRIHRGASHLFIATIFAHLLRVVVTGAFRRPREVNYHIGGVLLLVAITSGYTGHNLPMDALAGTSLRILYSFLLSIPLVGERVALWVFAGEFPTGDFISRMFVVHVLLLPAVLITGALLHTLIVARQTHTEPPHEAVDIQTTEVGEPLWPNQFSKTTTLVLAIAALVVASAVLVPWSDVDLHGPYVVAQASNASQPDWFLFWVEGALRLYPPILIPLGPATISGPFLTGIVMPLLLVLLLFAYPFVERRIEPSAWPLQGDHHVLQHPMDVPRRAGIVAAVATFMAVLTVAGGNDVVARLLSVATEDVIRVLRVAVVAAPPLMGWSVARYAASQPPRWDIEAGRGEALSQPRERGRTHNP